MTPPHTQERLNNQTGKQTNNKLLHEDLFSLNLVSDAYFQVIIVFQVSVFLEVVL